MASMDDDCSCGGTEGPFAVWRKMDGVPVFTGIVATTRENEPARFKRLDDDDDVGPDRLNGHGHEMCEGELLSQLSFYDDSTVRRAPFLDCRSCGTLHIEDESFFSALDANIRRRLVLLPKEVRTGDEVALCAIGTTTDPTDATKTVPYRERFWARVLSATPCGKVNVVPLADLHRAPVGRAEPVWYHVGSTLAAKLGENW